MQTTASLDTERLHDLLTLREQGTLYREARRREYAPRWYDWQLRFFAESLTHNQIMLLASNRSGKTLTGSYATAVHITGDYPDDWPGVRMNHPITAWVLGVDAKQTQEVMQKELLGVLGADGIWRGGWIHHDEIISIERSHLPGAIAKATIKNRYGESTVAFRSYTQTTTGQSTLPLAGSSVDLIQVDEQPPDGIIGQLATRTMTGRRGRGGLLFYTLTPELGMTDLVDQFMNHTGQHQALVGPIAWEECPHLSMQMRTELLATYPAHEADMRSKGVPMFGTGKVFSIDENAIQIDPIDLSTVPWWTVLRAIDIGIDHPTAIAWLAFDPESQTTHLCRTHRASDTAAAIHASVANSQWPHAPMVVPPDIDNREPGSGKTVRSYYEAAGIKPCLDFQNPDETRYVEPGLFAMQEAMTTGKFRIWRGLAPHFLEEARSYHRDEKGKVVKLRDDVISATRYGFQMIAKYGVPVTQRQYGHNGKLYPETGLNSVASRAQRQRTWPSNNHARR